MTLTPGQEKGERGARGRHPRIDLGALVRTLLGDETDAAVEDLEEVLTLSVASDGEVHPSEVEALRVIAEAVPGMESTSVARWVSRLSRGAAEVRVRGPAEDRLTAFVERMAEEGLGAKQEVLTLAALVQYVDGELVTEEEAFLESLAQRLGLSLDEAQSVIDRVEDAVVKAAGGAAR